MPGAAAMLLPAFPAGSPAASFRAGKAAAIPAAHFPAEKTRIAPTASLYGIQMPAFFWTALFCRYLPESETSSCAFCECFSAPLNAQMPLTPFRSLHPLHLSCLKGRNMHTGKKHPNFP